MKAEEDGNDSCSSSGKKHKKSIGVQCKAPSSKKNDQPQKGPSKADKSTSCNIPECPIVKQKSKIKEFMDKGQLCDIPTCPVKKPPPPPPYEMFHFKIQLLLLMVTNYRSS